MHAGQFLGLPFVPAYLAPTTKGKKVMDGVNYASAAGGILDDTGRNYVSDIEHRWVAQLIFVPSFVKYFWHSECSLFLCTGSVRIKTDLILWNSVPSEK